MLPPFGMRVDNSMGGSSLSASSLGGNSMGFMMHNQQLLQQNQQQMQQTGLVNGFDAPQSAVSAYFIYFSSYKNIFIIILTYYKKCLINTTVRT